MIKRTLYFVLALVLIPFYPLLKRIRSSGEKIKIGEKVVVVTKSESGNKITIQS